MTSRWLPILVGVIMLLGTAQRAIAQRLGPLTPKAEEPGANIEEMTRFDDKVYFLANDGVHGMEPWVSDGTEGGTGMLGDLSPGPASSRPRAFIEYRGRLFFVAGVTDNDGRSTSHLWSVSKSGQVEMHRQIYDGEAMAPLVMPGQSMTVWDDQLIFKGETKRTGAQLWATDGESETPVLLWCDPQGRPLPLRCNPRWTLSSTNAMYVIDVTGELWGMARGKRGMLKVFEQSGGNDTAPVGMLGDNLVFSYFEARTGREPYVATAQSGSAHLLKDINPEARNGCFASVTPAMSTGSRIFFAADDGIHGNELFETDGTEEGTRLLLDINDGKASSNPNWFQVLGDHVLFVADDGTHGNEIWITDGTPAGTQLLADLAPGPDSSNVHNYVLVGDRLFFDATTSMFGEELFVTDGTKDGTRLFADILPGPRGSEPSQSEFTSQYLIFTADDGIHGRELWRADLKSGDAQMVKDIGLPQQSRMTALRSMTGLGDFVYFVADSPAYGAELWCLPPGAEGPYLVQDLFLGPAGSHPEALTPLGDKLFFIADSVETGPTLWWTAPSEKAVHRAFPDDVELKAICSLTAWRERLFFVASDPTFGEELWCLTPPQDRPVLVKDICEGIKGSHPEGLCAIPNGVVFAATEDTGTRSFWLTDGTKEGTHVTSRLPGASIAPGK